MPPMPVTPPGRRTPLAEGFLSLFQTKLILRGIGDSRTLEAVSLSLGEYDRHLVSHNESVSVKAGWLGGPGNESSSTSYQTVRQRTLSPGEISQLPAGQGLLLTSDGWEPLRLAPWFAVAPWRDIALADEHQLPHPDAVSPLAGPRNAAALLIDPPPGGAHDDPDD